MAREFVVRDRMVVRAPIDRCFLLSCSIELVRQTLGMRRSERESQQRGAFIEAMGDQLVWRGWIFGLPQMHETLITGYDRPNFFQDTMGRGRFASFHHDHHFTEETVDGTAGTVFEDTVHFALPMGLAGALVGRVVMVPHVRGLVKRRFAMLKRIAEGEEWRRYLPAETA